MARGVLHGTNMAAQEFLKTTRLNAVAEWLESIAPLGGIEYELPKSGLGKAAAGLSQGAAGMIPAARLTRSLRAVSGFLRWTLAGAITDFAMFSPDDPGIGELAADLATLDDATLDAVRATIAAALAKGADDSELEKRLKNIGGGLLAGAALDGVKMLYRAAKGLKGVLSPEKLRALLADTGSMARGPRDVDGSKTASSVDSPSQQGTDDGGVAATRQSSFEERQTTVLDVRREVLGQRSPADGDRAVAPGSTSSAYTRRASGNGRRDVKFEPNPISRERYETGRLSAPTVWELHKSELSIDRFIAAISSVKAKARLGASVALLSRTDYKAAGLYPTPDSTAGEPDVVFMVIESDAPTPFTLLALAPEITTRDV